MFKRARYEADCTAEGTFMDTNATSREFGAFISAFCDHITKKMHLKPSEQGLTYVITCTKHALFIECNPGV